MAATETSRRASPAHAAALRAQSAVRKMVSLARWIGALSGWLRDVVRSSQPLPIRVIRSPKAAERAALRALMLAALALPGLTPPMACAQESDQAGLQVGNYQESTRRLVGYSQAQQPISAQHLHSGTTIRLADRLNARFNFLQDTWSGATPIATGPLAFFGNGYQPFEGLSGASPYLQISNAVFDTEFRPRRLNQNFELVPAEEVSHTISSASPEVRKQVDFTLTRELSSGSLDAGGGVSSEPDYLSRFGSLTYRWDLDRKRTTMKAGASYTSSRTKAQLDHDAAPYFFESGIDQDSFQQLGNGHLVNLDDGFGSRALEGDRRDWGSYVGLTRVLSRTALLETAVGYTRSTGYLGNPYKATMIAFVDPAQALGPFGELTGFAVGFLEQRPRERNQGTWSLGYVQHIARLDAGLHLKYRLFRDDWKITSHTLEAEWVQPLGHGLTASPRIRYYSQSAAKFYQPWILSKHPFMPQALDEQGRPLYIDIDRPDNGLVYWLDDTTGEYVDQFGNRIDPNAIDPDTGQPFINPVSKLIPVDRSTLPGQFSSDDRLSGYGALSGGITLSQQIIPGLRAELSYEYYRHSGALKLGRGGQGAFGDFKYFVLNAGLNVDLGTLTTLGTGSTGGERITGEEHASSHRHGGQAMAPAGVMFDHVMPAAGGFMVGYRYQYVTSGGGIRRGTGGATDAEIIGGGIPGGMAFLAPRAMRMHMHMFDLMYAPSSRLTLMLTPQLVDMNMRVRTPDGAGFPDDSGDQQMRNHHLAHPHVAGGFGDIGLHALLRLWEAPGQSLHGGLGLSVPTGDANLHFARSHAVDGGFMHYDMQLGSGTWDDLPSLTWIAASGERGSWGAQLSGVRRLGDRNVSGYALGNVVQATAWGGRALVRGVSGSLRLQHSSRGTIRGRYNGLIRVMSPMDDPANTGGRYWDVGFGLDARLPGATLMGNRLRAEWLQPLHDDVNGYQLARKGTLTLAWSRAL